jgi:hypothetical protein
LLLLTLQSDYGIKLTGSDTRNEAQVVSESLNHMEFGLDAMLAASYLELVTQFFYLRRGLIDPPVDHVDYFAFSTV